MKTNILFITFVLLFSCCTLVFSQGWEKLYPDFPQDKAHTANRVVPADDGGFHVLITESYFSSPGGAWHMMKTDNQGEVETSTTFGTGEHHIAFDMLQAANGDLIIVTRTSDPQFTFSDITFYRLDSDYNIINQSTIGLPNIYEQPRDIVELPNGEFWLTGLGAESPANSFLQKLDAQGQTIGQPIYSNFDYFYSKKILPGTNGGARVIGYGKINNTGDYKTFVKNYDSNGNFIDELIFENPNSQLLPNDIIETSDGGLLIVCFGGNSVLIKTDNTGTEEWRQDYTPPGFLFLSGAKELPGATGYRLLYREQYPTSLQHTGIIETDLQGNWLWKKEFSEYYFNEGQDIIILPDNGTLVTGHRSSTLNYFWSQDDLPYLIRTDALGNTLYSAINGNVQNDNTDNCFPDSFDLSAGQFITAFQDDLAVASGLIDTAGNYNIPAIPGDYKLAVNLPNFLWSSCQDSVDITLAENDTIYNQDFVIAYNNEAMDSIFGYIFEDYDNDCMLDSFETIGYEGWIVHLNITEDGNTIDLTDTTDSNGYYSFTDLMGFTNGAYYFINFEEPIGTGLTCSFPCWQEIEFHPLEGTSLEFNNGVYCDTLPFCPIMSVSIATDEIRPCIDEEYHIHYCNIGGTTAVDAYIEVTIDSALTINGSSIPWDAQSGNVYTFELGNLLSNECGSIRMDFFSPCNDTLGTTYCSEVYAYPDSTCVMAGPEWDGSEIELSVECIDDSVKFYIQNIGENMLAPLEYIVIEDNVLLYEEPQTYTLAAQQIMEVTFPVNGFFYRMSTQQPEGFPGYGTPISWIEGCGTPENINLGIVNQHPLGDEDSWHDIFCLESTNSYDPNDKTGFPRGIGAEHYIDQNESLEYLIRFQNSGTADALYVEIRDTLPVDFLDPLTVRPGASSHSYTWDIEGNGVIIFRFENINLPPEDTDPEGSKGFVQFKAEQRLNLPIGTEINNTAAIYFDNNLPIITNQTWHIIGQDYITTWIKELQIGTLQEIIVFPNPTIGLTHIDVKDIAFDAELSLELFDLLGNSITSIPFRNTDQQIDLQQLPAGTYFFKVFNDEKIIGVGKVIRQ